MIATITRMRRLRPALFGAAVLTLALAASGEEARADPCTDSYGNQVPNCSVQTWSHEFAVFATLQGWAFYCPANAPYYWGGWSASWTHSQGHVLENLFAEAGNLGKADFLFTNDSIHKNTVTLQFGCSPVNPNGPSCNNIQQVAVPSGPNCKSSPNNNVCTGDGEDEQCWQEWTVECVNGSTVQDYFCSDVAIVPMCWTCNPSSSQPRRASAKPTAPMTPRQR